MCWSIFYLHLILQTMAVCHDMCVFLLLCKRFIYHNNFVNSEFNWNFKQYVMRPTCAWFEVWFHATAVIKFVYTQECMRKNLPQQPFIHFFSLIWQLFISFHFTSVKLKFFNFATVSFQCISNAATKMYSVRSV